MAQDAYDKLIEEKARPVFEDLQNRAVKEGFIEPKVVYGYFPVQSNGNDLIVFDPKDFPASGLQPAGPTRELLRFTFPRQDGRRKLCISDFFRSTQSGQYDVLGIQLVTVGDKATELAENLGPPTDIRNTCISMDSA